MHAETAFIFLYDNYAGGVGLADNVSLWDDDMQDINKMMKDYARANYQKVVARLTKEQTIKEIELLKALATKHGATLIFPDSESRHLYYGKGLRVV